MSNVLAAHIQKNARFLKLSTLPAIYTQLAEKAVKSKLSYEEFLAILLEQEVAKKTDTSIQRRIFGAKFPFVKTIQDFDFEFH